MLVSGRGVDDVDLSIAALQELPGCYAVVSEENSRKKPPRVASSEKSLVVESLRACRHTSLATGTMPEAGANLCPKQPRAMIRQHRICDTTQYGQREAEYRRGAYTGLGLDRWGLSIASRELEICDRVSRRGFEAGANYSKW